MKQPASKRKPVHKPLRQELLRQALFGIGTLLLAFLALDFLSGYTPDVFNAVKSFAAGWGLPGVFLIVLLGSTLLPFPTDLAFASLVKLSANPLLLTLVAILAAFIGALINYSLARLLSRAWIEKLIGTNGMAKAKETFDAYGPAALLLFGVIPASPVFDSITFIAGLAKMDAKEFALSMLASRILHYGLVTLLALGLFGLAV